MGAQASMLWWPLEFCKMLAARGHYVLRFDHRDTGLSTKYPVGAPGYTTDDFADDVVAILDSFKVARAQLVGVSMGGMIGQIAGLKYPARFTRLAIISATPLNGEHAGLPGPSKAFMALARRGGKVDWDSREQAVSYMLEFGRVLAADEDFDEKAARALIEADFDRSGGYSHGTNHHRVQGGERWAKHLSELKPPLVVLHGRSDPLFPIEHGRALAKAVPGSALVEFSGGHGLSRSVWDPLIDILSRGAR
jgi:pimeloyl-ACP methyl ester carboxylesterase